MNALTICRNRLAEVNSEIRALNANVEAQGREKLLASEERRYSGLREERDLLDKRIAKLEEDEKRAKADAAAAVRLGNTGDVGHAYTQGADTIYSRTSGFSYFADLMAAATPGNPAGYEALQRLNDHAQLVERAAPDLPHEFRASRQKAAGTLETRVNPNRTDGQGGYFVPPLWIVNEAVTMLRAGRSTADRCNLLDLPAGTDSINLPKVQTGTTTDIQLDNGAVSSTDLTDNFVTGPVRTIAGQQDVAMQLLEQSPAGFDEVIFGDLIADYNRKLDTQALTGTGAAGQLKGIFNAGPNAITFTNASPTVPLLYVPLTQALSQVAKQRFKPADTIVMHPSRWYWIVAALDTQNRPLITPQGSGVNTIAVYDANAAEGVVGNIGGVPIVVDANIPTNVGAGTNQDRILVGRLKDAYLYEGAIRTRAMVEVLSGTLQVRLQVYNYVALISDRYPVAYSAIDGTGLIGAAGY